MTTTQSGSVRSAASPPVTIVIPVLNAVATVVPQVLTLLEADGPSREVVVGDNGSTDGSVEVVDQLARFDTRVRAVDGREAKRGGAAAKNLGVGAARSDVVLFCDADDLVSDTWLLEMSESVLANGLATCRREYWKLNPEFVRRAYPQFRDQYRVAGAPGLPGGAFGINRSMYIDVDGFDEDFRGSVDSEFSVRLFARFGIEPVHCWNAIVHCRVPASARSRFDRERMIARSRRAIDLKADPAISSRTAVAADLRRLAAAALQIPGLRDRSRRYDVAGRVGSALGRMSAHL